MPEDLPSLTAQLLSSGQHINGKNQANEKVDHAADQAAGPGAKGAHRIRNIGGEIHKLGAKQRRIDVIVLQKLQNLLAPAAVQKLHHIAVIHHDVAPEIPDTGDKLRHNNPDDHAQQQEHQEIRTKHRHDTGGEPGKFLPDFIQQPLYLTGGAVQQECNDQPNGNRAQHAQHIREHPCENLALDEQKGHQQNYNAAENNRGRPLLINQIPLPQFLFVLFLLLCSLGFLFLFVCCHRESLLALSYNFLCHCYGFHRILCIEICTDFFRIIRG